jgi:hypothetical protein
MLKQKDNTIGVKVQQSITDSSVVISSGSLVFDNKWIDYPGTIFNVQDYINAQIDAGRTRFFINRKYAVCLVVGVSSGGEIIVLEGAQALYTTLASVPIPPTFSVIPLVGIVLIQDGTSDMNLGFKPLKDNNIIFYSGMGNVIDKNLKGIEGVDSSIQGETGVQGETGLIGIDGITGLVGFKGDTGLIGFGVTGFQGAQGMTGINWDIQILFNYIL